MSGHYSPNAKWTNEVWGLAIPGIDGEHFTTCSDDATVRIWDLEKKEEIASERIDFDEKLKVLKKDPKTGDYQDQAKGRCVGLSRDGYVLVGCKDGTVKILDENLKPVSS
jgi:WD40 repeat protein